MTINPDWTFVDLVEAMGHDVLDLETFVVWYCRRVHYLGVHWGERYEQRMRTRLATAQAWLEADLTRTKSHARARFGVNSLRMRAFAMSGHLGHASSTLVVM